MSESYAGEAIIDWPVYLPLPSIDFTGQPRHTTIASPPESVKIQRRSRFTASVTTLIVQWVFSAEEFDLFKAFYSDDLDNGSALLQMELRYPRNSALDEWTVRLVGPYEAHYLEGHWEVDALLDLLHGALPALSPVVDFTPIVVMPPGDSNESDCENTEFVTRDGFCIFVGCGDTGSGNDSPPPPGDPGGPGGPSEPEFPPDPTDTPAPIACGDVLEVFISDYVIAASDAWGPNLSGGFTSGMRADGMTLFLSELALWTAFNVTSQGPVTWIYTSGPLPSGSLGRPTSAGHAAPTFGLVNKLMHPSNSASTSDGDVAFIVFSGGWRLAMSVCGNYV